MSIKKCTSEFCTGIVAEYLHGCHVTRSTPLHSTSLSQSPSHTPTNSSLQVWAETFAKALEGKDLKEILSGFHAAGSAAPSAGGASAAAGSDAAAEEEAPEEAAEESDDDMGFGLFD